MTLRFFLKYFDDNTNIVLWDGSVVVGCYDSISSIPLDILNKYNVLDTWVYTSLVDSGDDSGYFDCFLGIDVF